MLVTNNSWFIVITAVWALVSFLSSWKSQREIVKIRTCTKCVIKPGLEWDWTIIPTPSNTLCSSKSNIDKKHNSSFTSEFMIWKICYSQHNERQMIQVFCGYRLYTLYREKFNNWFVWLNIGVCLASGSIIRVIHLINRKYQIQPFEVIMLHVRSCHAEHVLVQLSPGGAA
jgi:hypothetical protein